MNSDEQYTKEFQKELNDYIELGFNQDACNGFMHGFHKGAESKLTEPKQSEVEQMEDRIMGRNVSTEPKHVGGLVCMPAEEYSRLMEEKQSEPVKVPSDEWIREQVSVMSTTGQIFNDGMRQMRAEIIKMNQ